MEKDEIIRGLVAYISSQDIDEFLCKKVDCLRESHADYGDEYDCYDCIKKFFSTSCKWLADNEVCVNDACEHCADFVLPEQCGSCIHKEIK